MEKETTFFKDYENLINSFEKFTKDTQAYNYKYTHISKILPEVKKRCKENNFIFFQTPEVIDGENYLKTTLVHVSGSKIEGLIKIVSKDNNDPQKVGGGLTYMRRYSLTCMFGLEEEDDDATKASGAKYNRANPQYENLPY